MALNYKAIGRRLRVARLALGLAERDFARVANVTLHTYRNWEAGQKSRGPGLVDICIAHDVSIDWLIDGEGACIGAHLRRSNSKIAILPVSSPRWRKHREQRPGGPPLMVS
jgi:transcriptional regulator with XRE-family HTH domain